MEQNEFKNVYCEKPWGKEFLYFENTDVAVWYLKIDKGQSTSMHCHPNKKTALLILDGIAEFSFLNDSRHLYAFDKVMIRSGVFHQTKAITDLRLLEFETPRDKYDLIRLEDRYGRAGTAYENQKWHKPLSQMDEPFEQYTNGIERISCPNAVALLDYNFKHVVLMEGRVYNDIATVLGPGDMVSRNSFEKLVTRFMSTELLVWMFY
jgi:mannose-6-phosphate isomerase-like protein (cupin superfamily)